MTITETAQEARESQAHAKQWLEDNATGRVLFTMVDYGSGQTDYVRVFISREADNLTEITYYASKALGNPSLNERGIARRGGGYNKALDVVDDIARLMTGEPVDQLNGWHEIH